VVPESCYDGTNGTLAVNVTGGNGEYQFSIDGGTTWQTPTPATSTSYTFTGLTNGSYNVTVQDRLGCSTTTNNHVINPELTATVATVNETCNQGQITATPAGGDGNYVYAVVATGVAVAPGDFSTTNPVDVVAGTYDVYVRDNSGNAGYCEFMQTVTITRIADPTIVATGVQPSCNGDTGTINVTISNGTSPYTTTVTGTALTGYNSTSGPSTDTTVSFTGLAADTYTIVTTDTGARGACTTTTATVVITEPAALSATARITQDYTCTQTGEITIENVTG
ncbi:hypothetical protein, partial [uncultured Tenacibaculum sp.]|uniref:hypothetical protein n=1 Tax=uncultured Tenacibaculum sp. TaxID=174713 RepID=UPI002616714C